MCVRWRRRGGQAAAGPSPLCPPPPHWTKAKPGRRSLARRRNRPQPPAPSTHPSTGRYLQAGASLKWLLDNPAHPRHSAPLVAGADRPLAGLKLNLGARSAASHAEPAGPAAASTCGGLGAPPATSSAGVAGSAAPPAGLVARPQGPTTVLLPGCQEQQQEQEQGVASGLCWPPGVQLSHQPVNTAAATSPSFTQAGQPQPKLARLLLQSLDAPHPLHAYLTSSSGAPSSATATPATASLWGGSSALCSSSAAAGAPAPANHREIDPSKQLAIRYKPYWLLHTEPNPSISSPEAQPAHWPESRATAALNDGLPWAQQLGQEQAGPGCASLQPAGRPPCHGQEQ
jgi:hypothetical protein